MKRRAAFIFLVLLSVFFLRSPAGAQTTEITFQGQLQSSSALANGNFDFEFLLFDSAGGGTQIGSTITRNGVAVANGIFSVNLDFGAGFTGSNRFLEIRVRQGGGGFTTLLPRQPVTSTPYAIKSLTADTASNASTATTLTGNLAGDVTGTQATTTVAGLRGRNVAATAPSGGQVLKFNAGTNQWEPNTDETGGGGGTITGVTAGTGLTGGGTTGNVSLSIANSGVATAQIADNAVTAAKIAPGQVVKSLNGLEDNVTLAAGSNITITPSGNTLTIASTGGSSGVGGSGATNTVPLWTGGTTLGNSVITQTAAGRVGIGIGSPSTRLEVAGDIRAAPTSGIALTGDSPTGIGVFGFGNTGVVGSGQNFGVDAQAPSPGRIALRTNGTSWFKGDTTPLNASLTGPGTGIAIGTSGALGYIAAFDYSVFQPRTLLLNNSGGNVGINTHNPTSRLHVVGSSDGGVLGTATGIGSGVTGSSPNGNGVFGQGAIGVLASGTTYGVEAFSTSGIGVTAAASARGGIALRAQGSSWFSGDTTPLTVFNAQPGTGIVIGSVGTVGYISAVDYSANAARTLLLNNGGGNVGINTNTPDQALSVNGNASKLGGSSWLAFSDERLKNIKGRFNGGLKAVMKLQPLRYEYKKDNAAGLRSEDEYIGFSAQEVEKVIPEAVTKTEQGIRLVNNDPIILSMLNAIKEQQALIIAQQRQINQLKQLSCRSNRKAAICKAGRN